MQSLKKLETGFLKNLDGMSWGELLEVGVNFPVGTRNNDFFECKRLIKCLTVKERR